MATIKLILGLFLFAVIGSNGVHSRHFLNQSQSAELSAARRLIVATAAKETGVRERSGNNDGVQVEEYLKTVNLSRGNPYCAAFVSWVFAKCGYPKPRTGWSPNLFVSSRLARSALPGNVIGIYFPEKKRIAHVGLVDHRMGNWIITVEANSNVSGSREGDGVYKKMRHIKTIHSFADWITERRTLP